jgi:hypothetical protein
VLALVHWADDRAVIFEEAAPAKSVHSPRPRAAA